jgi:hypothetical protein
MCFGLFYHKVYTVKNTTTRVYISEGVVRMRINTIIEIGKYDANRELKEQYEYKRKNNDNSSGLSFSEILKREKKNTYLKSKQ